MLHTRFGKIGKSLGRGRIGRRVLLIVLVVLAYAGLSILTTWPLATQLTSHLPGPSQDAFAHFWNAWWVQKAITSGQSPLFTPYLFYPSGVSLVTHNVAWLNMPPWLLLEPFVGGIAAYNLVIVLNLILCGCAVFWLTYRLTEHMGAAFLAGVIYLAWPFRLSQLDHPNLIATQWIPVFLLFLINALRRGRWRDGLIAGVLLALVGYTRWQLLIAAGILAAIYVAWEAPGRIRADGWHYLRPLALTIVVATVLLLPAGILLLRQARIEDNTVDLFRSGEEEIMQTDLLAYLTPPGSNLFLGEETRPLYDQYYGDRSIARRFPAYIGFVALTLLMLGILFERRASLPWLIMALILILLALGPLLRFNGHFYEGAPSLYRSLSPFGVIRLMRVPDRFNLFLALPVSVLAAFGARGLLRRLGERKQWLALVIFGLLGGLILFEYWMTPTPLQDPSSDVSPFYQELAQEPGEFAILNLPLDPLSSKVYMLQQTTHGHPIVQGKIARIPDDQYAYIDASPLLRILRQLNEFRPDLPDVSRQLRVLSEGGIRYIILNKKLAGPDRIDHWQRYLLMEPRFEDKTIAVYATDPVADRDSQLDAEMIPGLGPIDVVQSADCLNPGNVLEVDIGWANSSAFQEAYDVNLSLSHKDSGTIEVAERFPLSEKWPNQEWPPESLVWSYYPMRLPASMPPGAYTIELSLLQPEPGDGPSQSLEIGAVEVQDEICHYETAPEVTATNALYGDALRLLGYELRRRERDLGLTLYWRSERRMDSDYKVFVHVFDPETGVPVAQDDAMPRRGAYPTTFWWPGEELDDHITLFLEEVPAGVYGIAIGVYDPSTGERLPLVDGHGRSIADGRLILDELVEVN